MPRFLQGHLRSSRTNTIPESSRLAEGCIPVQVLIQMYTVWEGALTGRACPSMYYDASALLDRGLARYQ